MLVNEPRFVCDVCGRKLGGMNGMYQIDIPNVVCHEVKRFDLCEMCYAGLEEWMRKRANIMRGEDFDRT